MTMHESQRKTITLPPGHEILGAVPSPINVLVVDTLEDLASHADGWNRLSELSRDHIARHTYSFVQAYLRHWLAAQDQWFCLMAYAGSYLVGVMPVVVEPQVVATRLPASRLRSRSTLYPLTLLAAPGYETRIATHLITSLKSSHANFEKIAFSCMHEQSALFTAASSAFGGFARFKEIAGQGSYLPTVGSLPEYVRQLSSNLRKNLRRWSRRLQNLPAVRFEAHTGNQVTLEHFAEFLAVESSGWKGKLGSALACNPRQVRFYQDLFHNFARTGSLEMHFLKTCQRTMAAQMAMRVGSTLVLWKIAYDEQLAEYSPGNLLFYKTVERAFGNRDILEINCLTDMEWHHHWRMKSYQYVNLLLFPLQPVALLTEFAPRIVRRLIKQIPGTERIIRAWREDLAPAKSSAVLIPSLLEEVQRL